MTSKQITAIGLLSGGLDSILACRTIMAQGIRVVAIKFVTPFFGYDLLARAAEHRETVRQKYGIDVELRDVSAEYLELLRHPAHGFGKHFNPCIDCKIFMLTQARQLLPEYGASFIFTGEVVGQRPMSQRRDTLRVIERDSGCEGLLLRPLCAQNLAPTPMEENGLVDRARLLNFSGRNRRPQMELAARLNIRDYPSPAGGCFLADPTLGARLARFYQEQERFTVDDIRRLLVGRQFRLPNGGWLTIGRNQQDNERLAVLVGPATLQLETVDRPGPLALLNHAPDQADRRLAARLVARYAKKEPGLPVAVEVALTGPDGTGERLAAEPLADQEFADWRR